MFYLFHAYDDTSQFSNACPSERILSHAVHESAITYSQNASCLLRCVTYRMGDKRVMSKSATTCRLCVVHALRPFPVRARAGLTKSPKYTQLSLSDAVTETHDRPSWRSLVHDATCPATHASKHVRRRSEKSSSFGFSQVDMYACTTTKHRKDSPRGRMKRDAAGLDEVSSKPVAWSHF